MIQVNQNRRAARAFGPVVDVAWLTSNIDRPDVRVVDVRPAADYVHGHIPGAATLDIYALKLRDSTPEAIDAFDREMRDAFGAIGLRAGDRIVFYEDFSGTSAARGVWVWDYLGLGGSAMLDGGLRAWHATGGAIAADRAMVEPTALPIQPDRAKLATAGEIAASIAGEREPAQIIDTRNDLEHAMGTIPGAVHVEWIRNLNPDGTFRPLPELAALYRDAGIVPEREVVTFCASGYRAAHAYVVLTMLGYPDVRNYAPSWKEWSQRPGAGIAHPGR